MSKLFVTPSSSESGDSSVGCYSVSYSRSRSREPTEEELIIRKFLKAVQAGDVETFTAMHRTGVDVDTPNVLGETGLMLACKVGNWEIADTLIQWGADVQARSNEGRTPLTYAARYGHDHCVSRLILAGALVNEPNNDGYTPLMKATCYGHVAVVDWLLSAGADITLRNKDGRTALDLTKVLGQDEIRKKLEDFTKKRSPKSKPQPVFPTMSAVDEAPVKLERSATGFWNHYAKSKCSGNILNVAKRLEAQSEAGPFGVEVSTANLYKPYAGNTRLILASKVGDISMVETLIGAGADLEASNDDGDTCLITACRYGHSGVVRKLLAAGANFDATNKKGYTALMKTVVGRHTKCLDILLNAGADHLARNNEGRTAFDLASIFGEQAIRAKLRIME